MKKYLLIMAVALTTLFAASSEQVEKVRLNLGDIETIRSLTGYPLISIEEDADPYPEQNRSKYVSDGGNVIVLTYKDTPFKGDVKFAETLNLTVRFYAQTTGIFGKADSVYGLDVLERSTGQTYDIVLHSGFGGPRSVLVKSAASELPAEVKEFFKASFGVKF